MEYDLLSLVLTLAPLSQPDRPLPSWWGRSAHALLFDVLRQSDPALAEAIHDSNDARPFTVSSLIGRFPRRQFNPEGGHLLRITTLNAALSGILLAACQPGGTLSPGGQVKLDRIPFRVQACASQSDQHPLANTTTYPDLASGTLLGTQPPPGALTLLFDSPTNFSSKGRLSSNGYNIPFPLPDFVFGSLLDRWNAFSPVAFPAELRRYAAECLYISRFELRSRTVTVAGGVQVGMTGWTTFRTRSYDRYWMSLVHTLAQFAFYAGVGAKTAMGLGQCRVAVEGNAGSAAQP